MRGFIAMQSQSIGLRDLSSDDVFQFHLVATFGFGQATGGAKKFKGDMTAWHIYWAFLVACAADALGALHRTAVGPDCYSSRLSAHSISEMTGIPRQTVRRKCLELYDRGILRACDKSLYQLTLSKEEIRSIVIPFMKMARKSL